MHQIWEHSALQKQVLTEIKKSQVSNNTITIGDLNMPLTQRGRSTI